MFFAGHTTSPIRPSVVAADICLVCVENTLVLSREEMQRRLRCTEAQQQTNEVEKTGTAFLVCARKVLSVVCCPVWARWLRCTLDTSLTVPCTVTLGNV